MHLKDLGSVVLHLPRPEAMLVHSMGELGPTTLGPSGD